MRLLVTGVRGSSARTSSSGCSQPARTSWCSTSSRTPATRRTCPGRSTAAAATSPSERTSTRSARSMRSSTSPPRRTSTGRSSARRTSCGRTCSERSCSSRRRSRQSARFVQVSTDEVYGDVEAGLVVARGRPAPPVEPVQRVEGGRRPAGAGGGSDVRRQRVDHTRLEHLRAEPVSGEGAAALRRRTRSTDSRYRSTATAARCATGCTSTTTAPRSSSSFARVKPARSTTSVRDEEHENVELTASHRRAARRGHRTRPPRRGPRRPRPALLARHDEDSASLGWQPRRGWDDGVRAHDRLVPRQS